MDSPSIQWWGGFYDLSCKTFLSPIFVTLHMLQITTITFNKNHYLHHLCQKVDHVNIAKMQKQKMKWKQHQHLQTNNEEENKTMMR